MQIEEMSIYFLTLLMTVVVLFLIMSSSIVASFSSAIVPANTKGFKSPVTIDSQSKQSPVIPSTSPEVESGKGSGWTMGTPFTASSPPAELQQQQPNRLPVMTARSPTVTQQCSSGLVVSLPQCHNNNVSSSTGSIPESGSTLPSSRNNSSYSIGYLISCNQTSERVPTGKVGQIGMKVTIQKNSNLALQGGEFLCDLVIPGSTTKSSDVVARTSAKDFASGYNFGKQDSTRGLRDPPGSCNSERGITNITACYYGYIQGLKQQH